MFGKKLLGVRAWAFYSLLLLTAPVANAGGACTYNEALMALQQGNMLRGQALMAMAANDGDARARGFLTSFKALAQHDIKEKQALIAYSAAKAKLDP